MKSNENLFLEMSNLTTQWISNAMNGEAKESDTYTPEQIDRTLVNTRADVAALVMHAMLHTTALRRIRIGIDLLVVISAAHLLLVFFG